jgi:N-acetylmuramoyl-L-alanine amidase
VKGESIGNFTGSRTAAEVEYRFRCCALQPWVSHFSIDIRIGFWVFSRFTSPLFIKVLRLCLCVLAVCCVELAQAATVKNVRIWRADGYTRVVLDLDAPVRYNLVLASNPTRIILDVASSNLKASVAKLPLASTPIDIVRSSVVNNTDVRLVFDLNRTVSPKSFLLKKFEDSDDRLVIDLYDAPSATAATSSTVKTSAATNDKASLNGKAALNDKAAVNDKVSLSEKTPTKTSAVTVSESENIEALMGASASSVQAKNTPAPAPATVGRTILIAVDAGHGGADSGALGPKNMREKDVTLSIAKELVRIINAQPGYSARLTRTGDYFIPLQKRRDFARDMKADLFISVHADSFTNPSAYGASVFALSRKGATSEMARFLAQRENDSDLIGRVGGVSLEDKDPQLAGVLVDLSMTATVNSSLQVGSKVLSAISAIAPLHAKHVEQAGFMVLKSPDVPSILVETGFISNPTEAKKLASLEYRERMAQAIFKGVRQYFTQHPVAPVQPPSGCCAVDSPPKSGSVKNPARTNNVPKSTRVKDSSTSRKHLVVRGDTLTDIALRYGVSASKIKAANNMKNDTVKLGQTLKIPAQ